ncbi:hypothetical protein BVRB_8g195770 [Beta vulgaris subsp. vulgaris]|nr:hypothetical protein BVRB_8g195770 [Beta vulgaris subsp. vulgaris]
MAAKQVKQTCLLLPSQWQKTSVSLRTGTTDYSR